VTALFREKYGSWAVVAGASEGLGAAFADCIAQQGINLILIARRADVLEKTAESLRTAHHIEVITAALDLASPTLSTDLQPYIQNREIGLLVYNAAVSIINPFVKTSLEDKLRHVRVNCDGPLIFASLLGSQMVARKRGGIILMSSAAGLKGTELITTYAATKAFNWNLAEGLWQEWGKSGVDVLGVIAGSVQTPNYGKSQPQANRFTPAPQDPHDLAEKALKHLGKGYPIWRSTWLIRFMDILLTRLLPRSAAVRFFSNATGDLYKQYRE
jgi:short-subunit dehydrogenase